MSLHDRHYMKDTNHSNRFNYSLDNGSLKDLFFNENGSVSFDNKNETKPKNNKYDFPHLKQALQSTRIENTPTTKKFNIYHYFVFSLIILSITKFFYS